MAKRAAPEVNAGSMADIAFLLLIFFLVTTTIETDSGISRKLPPPQPEDAPPPPEIKMKNVFQVLVSRDDRLLVEDELMELKDVRNAAIAFLDNNGDSSCKYCKGSKEFDSSDNPEKAVISLNNDRETSYSTYISVQNELVAAYTTLRNREAKRLYNRSFEEMEADYGNLNHPENKDKLKEKIKIVKNLFPEKLSEAEAK